MSSSLLNVIDKEGNVLYQATRKEIHEKGLLHADVNVWLYTPKGELIFQHRSKTKDTYPDLLDATVGGHVEIGDTYEISAVKEVEEETGLQVSLEDLQFVDMIISKTVDPVTNTAPFHRKNVYAYRYVGAISDLHVEEGQSYGFVAWPFEKLFALSDAEKKQFIPFHIEGEGLDTLRKIHALAKV